MKEQHQPDHYSSTLPGTNENTNIRLVEDERFYVVGTSGGVSYDRICPYEGTSWCEPSYPWTQGDLFNGFVARMNLQGISIGLAEHALATNDLMAFPNPASDQITVHYTRAPLINCSVRIFDAKGAIVASNTVQSGGVVPLIGLSMGLYNAVLNTASGEHIGTFRFIKK